MKKNGKITLFSGVIFISLFIVWAFLITTVDVKSVGVNGTDIGFATINTWFHNLIGVNMTLYTITDWLGLVPVFICMIFGVVGLIQLIKRKSLLKVDFDIVVLGLYYVFVVFTYLLFEMIPINYRPILINGFMEASYPSSTTLLVLSVMPTLVFQVQRRLKNEKIKIIINIVTAVFSLFMVIGRLISGVHWFSDIFAGLLISASLVTFYEFFVKLLIENNSI